MPDVFLRLMEKCVFFYFDFWDKGDASNINQPQHAANGG